jgi:Ribbon-helix-helix protein, copG family
MVAVNVYLDGGKRVDISYQLGDLPSIWLASKTSLWHNSPMSAKSPQKGAPQPMRKVTVRLPEDLARTLKMKAAEELTSITEIITRALEREFEKGGRTSKN